MKNFPIAGATLPKPGQPATSNADAFAYAVVDRIAPEILLIVCDGLSSSQNGSGAAKMTCSQLVRQFDKGRPHEVLPEPWLKQNLIDAHQTVRHAFLDGDARCTVVAALVDIQARHITIAHAGDSPAYLYRNDRLEQLTTDHLESEVRQAPTGQGHYCVTRALTNYVGKSGDFDPSLLHTEFSDGDYLCLASDGIPAATLGYFLRNIQGTPRNDEVVKVCQQAASQTDDDSTLLIVRLGVRKSVARILERLKKYATLECSERETILRQAAEEVGSDMGVLRDCFHIEQDDEMASLIVDQMIRNQNELTKQQWITLLELAISRKQRTAIGKLTTLLRGL
ncbi:PP2C family protein-serine/threonine phosphatase [Aporhodopirellula aestuarii]|uniref:SpoIIE family protein phosphatase n=1 Tax=Aporhodopirellula aestuarii TaxID=2950107 RepID=A0ABT0UDI1_9BACT|nr:protein phosphatase 2C domain-containing protein [Aporhodopirellula aestuarii]MCM2374438.1 SpoIIE family protein phosphatase [Aporhodopirellula aestuarii]